MAIRRRPRRPTLVPPPEHRRVRVGPPDFAGRCRLTASDFKKASKCRPSAVMLGAVGMPPPPRGGAYRPGPTPPRPPKAADCASLAVALLFHPCCASVALRLRLSCASVALPLLLHCASLSVRCVSAAPQLRSCCASASLLLRFRWLRFMCASDARFSCASVGASAALQVSFRCASVALQLRFRCASVALELHCSLFLSLSLSSLLSLSPSIHPSLPPALPQSLPSFLALHSPPPRSLAASGTMTGSGNRRP
jgi:hypothetical protein